MVDETQIILVGLAKTRSKKPLQAVQDKAVAQVLKVNRLFDHVTVGYRSDQDMNNFRKLMMNCININREDGYKVCYLPPTVTVINHR